MSSEAIVPDTKDWTWVLDRPCSECGLDTSSIAGTEVGGLLRYCALHWVDVLAQPGVRQRPQPAVWSPLEYGCHVRDTCRLYAYRLNLMLTEDDPLYPNWDQDETAIAERYGEQDPATVSGELVAAVRTLADRFDAVKGEQWQRPGRRSDGAQFTVETFARYFIHDPMHHYYDVTGQLP